MKPHLWITIFLGILAAAEILHLCARYGGVLAGNATEMLRPSPGGQMRRPVEEYDYTKYHTMEEIYQWMEDLERKFKGLVSQHQLGTSFESRPIMYLKISIPATVQKRIIWLDCNIHAREWITGAFCQWFVKEIVYGYHHDPGFSRVLNNVDLYVLPVFNIDGYVYSWSTNRLWRKSRALQNNETCHGVDLNRNFDAAWCSSHASPDCRSEEYCGVEPASEPETKALVNFVTTKKADMLCYLTFHSFSQVIMFPYGYTSKPSRNHNEAMEIAIRAAEALKLKYGTDYQVGPFFSTLYPAAGTSQDWVFDQGVEYSFSMELRDRGQYGFLLPEDQIKPTCDETMAAVMTIFNCIFEKKFPASAPIMAPAMVTEVGMPMREPPSNITKRMDLD